jgi:hypothetical protein
MCNDNSDNNHIYASNQPIIQNIINYDGNPNIFIISDVSPCTKKYIGDDNKDNKNIYIYLDYDENPDLDNLSLKELTLTKLNITTNNQDNNKDNIININNNGFENMIDCTKNNNLRIILNPKDLLMGFTSIINLNNNCPDKASSVGLIYIDYNNVLKQLSILNNCVKYNFYLTKIDFTNPNNYIDDTNKIGPYTSITYIGTPQIKIYIQPYTQSTTII